MIASRRFLARTASLVLGLTLAASVQAAELHVAIRQSQQAEVDDFQGLVSYLAKRGINLRFVTVPGYREAAAGFADGSVDAMFGGSGVSCAMMVTGIAEPFARLVYSGAPTTYAAVIVAKKGTPAFDGTAAWFAGKKVAYQPLASSGEFFFRSLGPSKASAIVLSKNHAAALAALGRGEVDVAVVKNHAWTKEKGSYPGFEQVGQDTGVNPDGPFVVSTKLSPGLRKQLLDALMALEEDPSPEAVAAKKGLKIQGFAKATPKDFRHTMELVERAGVKKGFKYEF